MKILCIDDGDCYSDEDEEELYIIEGNTYDILGRRTRWDVPQYKINGEDGVYYWVEISKFKCLIANPCKEPL